MCRESIAPDLDAVGALLGSFGSSGTSTVELPGAKTDGTVGVGLSINDLCGVIFGTWAWGGLEVVAGMCHVTESRELLL